MRSRVENGPTPTENRIRRSTSITVACDVVLILALVVCLLLYISINNAATFEQNTENITNIATAKSELMLSVLDNSSREVLIAYRFCNGKSVSEIMDYLSITGGEADEYQLLKRNTELSNELYHVYYGFSTKKKDGGYQQIEYKDTDLSSSLYQNASRKTGEVCYSQSFTNKTDAQRYFAVFCSIEVNEDGELQQYFLVKPRMESDILDLLRTYTQYGRLSTAICYPNGKYLARDDDFRTDNFYDYLYQYNDLSIDERNAIREEVLSESRGSGFLQYKNQKNQDSVFAYAACGAEANWYIFVSVPTTDFVSDKLLSFFPLIIIIFLAVLLVFNIWRLLVMVKQLRQSAKRERIANLSKSSFLSRMSHEIRTPLNAIIGYNTIAKNEISQAKDEAEHKQAEMQVMGCLLKSEIASRHLLTIINDVLDMSAIESGKIEVVHERFDFKGLITSLTTVFYSQARAKNVEFDVLFDTLTEEWFVGDQMRTSQILTNLLSNAIKFTPEGGTVVLRIQQPEAEVNAAHIHFEVSDTGIGMSKEYLKRIWSPFEQADSTISRRFGGTGLGLSIAKSLVGLMNGEITVESTQGTGTTFYVDLTFERTDQPYGSGIYNFNSVNALVVDDDNSTCEYIRLLFNRCCAKCVAVTSGRDAVEAVSRAVSENEPYSICLIDWRMPGMDGIAVIKRIREMVGEQMPIIVLTAYDFAELADKADELGVNKFISKPLFQSSLFDLLASVNATPYVKPAAKQKKVDFNGARVLLAEDNSMNMEIAQRILQSAGLVVDNAWNGREAVERFESSPAGTYSAILMDVHMPEMDGHEATRIIRASDHPEAKTIPIIAMTADAFAENVAEALAAGMNDHIAKPINTTVLFDTLKKYTQHK